MTHSITVKTLLQSTSRELCDLLHIAEGLQSVLSTGDKTSDEALKTYQKLDYLTQSLEALSEFWLKTKEDVSENWSIDCKAAINDIKLKDLAASMRGDTSGSSVSQAQQGILEEF